MVNENNKSEEVHVKVELTGKYENIAAIIAESGDREEYFNNIYEDMNAVLEIVVRTEGATKSRIVEELPASVTADLDVDAVIHLLRVLELYELVELDGNTWRPGSALVQQ